MVIIIFLLFTSTIEANVRFCAVGDIMLDRGVKSLIRKNGVDFPYEKVTNFIRKNDIVFCNLECSVSSDGSPLNKRYCFNVKPWYIEGLKNAGFNVISIANNHTLDWGREAFLETKYSLEKMGLYTVGGGKNQKEARAATIIECKGIKFAFLGYIDMLLEGITYLPDKPAPAWASVNEIKKEIKKVRNKVDFVIVSFHWGIEFQHYPTINQIKTAHSLVDAGADLILGHHPHVIQSIEKYKGRYIVYSLGNFIFDQHKLYQRESMIFCCEFEKRKISNPYIIPVIIKKFRPFIAEGASKRKIIDKINLISEEFNTRILIKKDKSYIVSLLNYPEKDYLLRYKFNDKEVIVYKTKIVLLDKFFQEIDTLDFEEKGELKDCCAIKEDKLVYVYGILGKRYRQRGEHIVVFPITEEDIKLPYIDTHKFNPWKILLADVDGDGKKELCVAVFKKTRYHKKYDNRLFVFNRVVPYFYPKWLGSKFVFPFLDFDFSNIDEDGKYELILLESGPNHTKNVVSYKWNNFGFKRNNILIKNFKKDRLSGWRKYYKNETKN